MLLLKIKIFPRHGIFSKICYALWIHIFRRLQFGILFRFKSDLNKKAKATIVQREESVRKKLETYSGKTIKGSKGNARANKELINSFKI